MTPVEPTGAGAPPDACADQPAVEAEACRAIAAMAKVDLRAPIADDAALARRQAAACDAFGARMTACSVADARASLSPAELADLRVDELAPKLRADAEADCLARTLSPRQLRHTEGCLGQVPVCADLLECFDQTPDGAAK